jgi:hypothetical protein
MEVNTTQLQRGLAATAEALARFRMPRVVVPVFRKPLLRIRIHAPMTAAQREAEKNRCADCGIDIPRGRAGRTCKECRSTG